MDSDMPVTQGDIAHFRAVIPQLFQNQSALHQELQNSLTQLGSIRMTVFQNANIANQRHHDLVGNIADVQERIIDFAHRHPVEMLQTEVTGLHEQIRELLQLPTAVAALRQQVHKLSEQATAEQQVESRLQRVEEVVQRLRDQFTGVQHLTNNLVTRITYIEGQADGLLQVHNPQQNEINQMKAELAAILPALVNAGLLESNTNANIYKWLDNSHSPRVLQAAEAADQGSIKAPEGGSKITSAVSSFGDNLDVAPTQAADLVPAPRSGDHITPVGVINGNNNNCNLATEPHTVSHVSTPGFRPGLNPEAPDFIITTISAPPKLRGGYSVAETMEKSENTGQEGARKDNTKEKKGLEDSMWAPGNYNVGPAHQDQSRQPGAAPAISMASSNGNTAAVNNWDAGLRMSMWAPRDGGAGHRRAHQPKISHAIAIVDPNGKAASAVGPPGHQGVSIIDPTARAPSPALSPSAVRANNTPSFGTRNLSATVEDAGTNSSETLARDSFANSENASNSTVSDSTTQFLAHLDLLRQQYNFSAAQAANLVNIAGYGNVNQLGAVTAGGNPTMNIPNTNVQNATIQSALEDDGQLIPGLEAGQRADDNAGGEGPSTFAGLVLLEDDGHAQHLQTPIAPSASMGVLKPFSLKEELEGVVRHNNQLGAKKAASTGQGGGLEDDGGEVHRLDVQGSNELRSPHTSTPNAAVSETANANANTPTVTVTTSPGPVTMDGNITIIFHNVKFKAKANGNHGNKPTYKLGHLDKRAYDYLSINLVFTIARGNPPTIAITATTARETLITITFILPTYIQSMDFTRVIANGEGILVPGSEPMNELSALKNTDTGIIPGHLRKVSFNYNTCNFRSAMVLHKREAEYEGMEPTEALVHRFFTAVTDWEGGAIEALFTDETNDAGVVDEVLGAFEALYVSK